MRKRLFFITAVLSMIAGHAGAQDRFSLAGAVQFDGEAEGKVIIRLYAVDSAPGTADFFTGDRVFTSLKLDAVGEFAFANLPPNRYIVTAFIDSDGDGALDFDPPEPFGWFQTGDNLLLARLDLRNGSVSNAKITLRLPTYFPREEKACEHGALRWMKGLPVLQLWGTAEERGYAHGFLVGEQIIDFFESYILETMVRSAKRYEEFYVPFFESRFNLPEEFEKELDAVIAGMRAAGADMEVDLLGRDFNRTDLLAINAYIERRAANPVEPVKKEGCSQFALWGPLTRDGGLIAGRNMDGECDLRKVTVSHFLTFAVAPAEAGRKRWVSTMWPGFVGTISGINEDGLYGMENAGPTGPGEAVGGLVPCAWVQRYALETLGPDATPESVLATMNRFKCEGGGITAAGSVILWAVPYNGQEAPAFIYEGDRNGGVMRTPAQVRPFDPHNILGTNHYRVYGVDERGPSFNFGREIFCWRYETGLAALEAWCRINRKAGLEEMKHLLQTVAHGSTEYSVIFLANERKILIADDDLMADLWDAPHLKWVEFEFDELFRR
jgi:uncharacterized protein (DUF2141 family)